MKNTLANRLRELRGVQSQTEFAAKIGVNQTSYSSWERGSKDPAAQTLAKIASTFGVTSDWLLGLSNVRSAADALAPSSAPTSKTVPMQKVFTPKSSTHEVDLLAEIRALKARVSALESQPTFACG